MIETIKTNSDFRRAYKRGKSYTSPALVVYVTKNRAGVCRYGITASKKIGNAVERNRARRVLRESFRLLCDRIKPGYDIVLVARTKTVHRKSTDIYPVMADLLQKSGVFNDETV